LAINVDSAVRHAIRPDWKKNFQKQKKIELAIYENLLIYGYNEDDATIKTNDVFDLAKRQVEYDE
jgi:type I restriction enzyme R subunit